MKTTIKQKLAGKGARPNASTSTVATSNGLLPGKDRRGKWVKGFSGNNLGRPRTALADLCRREIDKCKLAQGLGDIFLRRNRYKDAEVSDCIGAAKLLLAYGFGPPRPDVVSGDVKIQVVYDNRKVINGVPAPADDPEVIDVDSTKELEN